MGKILSTLLALGLLGCGSSPKPASDPSPTLGGTPADATPKPVETEETAEQKFARQQTDAVGKTCERIAECMVYFAKEELTPEQVIEQKIDDPQTLVMATDNCRNTYSAPMSPQQVIGLRECLSVPSECNAFVECFGEALSPKQ